MCSVKQMRDKEWTQALPLSLVCVALHIYARIFSYQLAQLAVM